MPFPLRRPRAEVPPSVENDRRISILRTRILREMQEKGWRRLVIVPVTSGAGATTLTVALTNTIHRQSEIKLLVADLNLANPGLAAKFGLEGGATFGRTLEKGNGLFPLVKPSPKLQMLDVVAPSAGERDGAEVLQSHAFSTAFAELEEKLTPDIVLLDSAPLIGGDLGLSAVAHADAVLLVADGRNVKGRDIAVCERLLVDMPPLMGIVLNNVEG